MAAASVRVEPSFVEFDNVSVGQVYRTTVTVHNVGKTSKKIRLEKPVSKWFKFTTSSPAVVLAPGLSVCGLLEYTPQEEMEVTDCLVIHIEDVDELNIPLRGIPRTCRLLIDPILDFGCVVASRQIIRKGHPIINQGSASGVFQVHYSGASSLRLSPLSGVIPAGSTQWLNVELCADRPCFIDEKAQVKLQNCAPVILRIKAELVDQHLEVLDLQGSPLAFLQFGPVYFGTSRVEKAVLKNNSPQACDWACVFQDAAGTEAGTDIQKSTNAALLERMKRRKQASVDVSQVLGCVPKQGRLGPYDTATLSLSFSPFCKSVVEGRRADTRCQQDYCLFLFFETVESRHGYSHSNVQSNAELAVTGSGFPVSLVPHPSERFDFLKCEIGQHVDHLCVLKNLCSRLPVSFRFRTLAHFLADPSAGTIAPGQCQDVVLSFNPRQLGSFQVCLKLDVLGYVIGCKDDSAAEEIPELELSNFQTVTLHLSGVCQSGAPEPVSQMARCRGISRVAVLGGDRTTLHRHRKKNRNPEVEELLAFPDDRALSIRPASSPRQYRTIFTGVNRYRYVDTDYAYTEVEKEQRKRHQQIYADFIKQLRRARMERLRREEICNEVEIGLVPAQGLVPPKIGLRDLKRSGIHEMKPDLPRISRKSAKPFTHKTPESVKASPSTHQEVADCTRTLTPQELYTVVTDPTDVDFGHVCVQSVCARDVVLRNPLSVHIWLQLDVDLPELQGSSPLSHVLPPHSQSTLCLTFQSNKLGPFCRPFSYSINRQHLGQILVQAQVVPLTLELSTNPLTLRPTPGLLATFGYRSFITLSNHCNRPAEFTWRPVVTERGILFSVRPATGVVEPYRELDCEVVWHPSFSAPSEGDFDLCVHEGNKQRLRCVAKVAPTRVQLAEKHILFRSVPLNMPSVRMAVLHNCGQNHAYYQVTDVCPIPGMVVTPAEGTVPSRGQATLEIHYNPDRVVKFDTRIEIALRGMKPIELRVGGSVEPPNVDISVRAPTESIEEQHEAPELQSQFQLHGVHTGSRRVVPFALTNQSPAAARVTFDLSEHQEFSLQLPRPRTETRPGLGVVELRENQTMDCALVFSPTELMSCDFELAVTVNGVKWLPVSQPPLPTSSLSSSPTSSSLLAGRRHRPVTSASYSGTAMEQQSPSVRATVLCAPIEMSPSSLHFSVDAESDTYSKEVELKAAHEESVCWKRTPDDHISWYFALHRQTSAAQDRRRRAICEVCPSSGALRPGQAITVTVTVAPETVTSASESLTRLCIPLYLGEREGEDGEEGGHQAFRELSITITKELPNITIHPPQILLTPIPLKTSVSATLTLMAAGYSRGTRVHAEVDEVETKDGPTIKPVDISFPQGNTIPAGECEKGTDGTSLLCSLTFRCDVPLSLCSTVTFTDHLNNRFQAKLFALTDNCLLSVWPYMAQHYSEQQIVLNTDVEAILLRCPTPSPASGSATSSSLFEQKSSTNRSSGPFPDTDSESEHLSSVKEERNGHLRKNPGFPHFPAAHTEEGRYYQSVLISMERWFSLFGWPGGPHPITVPHTLRRVGSNIGNSPIKDSRSVLDMLHHLTGIRIPGIPRCRTVSRDLDHRTKQLRQQHETTLDFLSVQGAHLCHIRPEYLLDVPEFEHWCSVQLDQLKYRCLDYESLSKRSWTDVLLQIYKVLVLCRVSESPTLCPRGQADTDGNLLVSLQPLNSNIYSSHELRLLSWLNVHYQSTRTTVWEAARGGVPAARWIVNFDLDLTDGLVLAALLAAHCPFLIESHFLRMYTTTRCLEQILHNNVIVTQALTALGLNINIQPTDLSDPNPVQMLILCAHLYERLPQYLPVDTITLSGDLHSTLSQQVRLRNPSSKPIGYDVFVFSGDAHLFSLPDGPTVKIPPNSTSEVTVCFSCCFLQPKEATLLLISSSAVGLRSVTLAFKLKTHVKNIKPAKIVSCTSACYQLRVIQLPISNTFNREATFRVVLVESTCNPLQPDDVVQQASYKAKAEETPSDNILAGGLPDKEDCEFLSTLRCVSLGPRQASTLGINYMPFFLGTKHCSVLLVCPQVGDMVYMIKATSELPLPSPLSAKPSAGIESLASNAGSTGQPSLCLHCKMGEVCEAVLRVPSINLQWEKALAVWGRHGMSAEEHSRRALTRTLHSSTVRVAAASQKLCRQMVHLLKGVDFKEVKYSVEVSLPQYFVLPSTVTIPIREDAHLLLENSADCGSVDVPLRFLANTAGQFECKVVLTSWCDTRVYLLQGLVTPQFNEMIQLAQSPASLLSSSSETMNSQAFHEDKLSPAALPHRVEVPVSVATSPENCNTGMHRGFDSLLHVRSHPGL